MLYYWHISDLKIYDEPKKINEFRKPDEEISGTSEQNGHTVFYDGYINGEVLKKPPQSWCYVEELEKAITQTVIGQNIAKIE